MLFERVVLGLAVTALVSGLAFVNWSVWFAAEFASLEYVTGMATGMAVFLIWFQFLRRFDQ